MVERADKFENGYTGVHGLKMVIEGCTDGDLMCLVFQYCILYNLDSINSNSNNLRGSQNKPSTITNLLLFM